MWPNLRTSSAIVLFERDSLQEQRITLATGKEHLGSLGWHIYPTERYGTTKRAQVLAELSDFEQRVFAVNGLDLPSANNFFWFVLGHSFRSDVVIPIERMRD